jgi:hypothetical protein
MRDEVEAEGKKQTCDAAKAGFVGLMMVRCKCIGDIGVLVSM